MKQNRNGFTLLEMLIVVAIIAILVAISVPTFSKQLEKTREAVDLSNVRSAYADVLYSSLFDDRGSHINTGNSKIIPLTQKVNGWTMQQNSLAIGSIAASDSAHWRGTPRAGGHCRVYLADNNEVIINWSGETHINNISAQDFLTKDILESIVGANYPHTVINSNEKYEQGDGTKAFLDYAKKLGFNLEDYDAATWQIYVKDKNSKEFLDSPAIYWSTLKVTANELDKMVPVMGFRDGKYDVYYAKVVKYNTGANTYYTIPNNFAEVLNSGGKASFQFDNYEDARAAYDQLLDRYEKQGGLNYKDITDLNLHDKK